MDDDRKTGVRFVAFVMVALALTEIGWAWETDGGPLVGALTGLAVAFGICGIIMAIATSD